MYDEGLGVEIDDEQAVYWYQQSAKQGHAKDQNNLGNMYHAGKAVDKNDRKAIHLYERAAQKGIFKSQYNVGLLYFLGRGVAKDNLQAYVWMFVSRANGYHDNNRMLEKVVQTLTDEELNKAQGMSNIYLENIS